MTNYAHTILRRLPAALIISLACGCAKPPQPTFSPGSYTPDPSAYPDITTAAASEILGRTSASIMMFEQQLHQPLFGDAQLSVSTAGLLMLNLRHLGGPDRSPCSFWFHAPVHPGQWETSTTLAFQVALSAGQYVVEENCSSPYDESLVLVLTFGTPADGEVFMNLMAALEQQLAAVDSQATP